MSVDPSSDLLPQTTVWTALEQRAKASNAGAVLTAMNVDWSAGQLRDAALELAGRLVERGIIRNSHVLTMLPNSIDHALLFLALARVEAITAAIAPDQAGPGLKHIVETLNPDLIIATPKAGLALEAVGVAGDLIVCFDPGKAPLADTICAASSKLGNHSASLDDVRAIIFTSGTTGPPKGAQVTERMLVASAWGAALAADAETDDRFLLWEPLYHIGGSQLLVLALLLPIRLFLVPKFSASQFWHQIRQYRITKLHYLGGVLEILLAQPKRPVDGDHSVQLAFGAGARRDVWKRFEQRFKIPLREVYGLTEASSFSTINRGCGIGSIGRAVPWIEVGLQDTNGREVANGEQGEIVIKPKVDGLLTPGYLGEPAATNALLQNGALRTGDLAARDDTGALFFKGRKKDAIRVRGEIISAWEVEAALLSHRDIAECAAIGIDGEIGEQEILIFIRPVAHASCDLSALADWSRENMPRRIRPRYWRFIEDFPRTPSARIAKPKLPRGTDQAFDINRGF